MTTSTPDPRTRSRSPRLLLGGLLLLGLAVVLWIPAAMTSMDHDWPEEARVPADGAAHTLAVQPGGDTLVWVWQPDVAPRCEVRDSSGSVPLADESTHYERGGGSAGPWVARWAFTSDDPSVEVTCTSASDGSVMVEARPLLPGVLSGLSWLAWLTLVGAVVGVLCVLAGLAGLAGVTARALRRR